MEKALQKLVEGLVKNTPLALIAIGVSLFVLGASGGYGKLSVQGGWRTAFAILGVVLIVFGGLILWRGPGKGDEPRSCKTYDLKITSPKENAGVAQRIRIEGTYRKKPPENSMALIEWSATTGRYWFKRQPVAFIEEKKEWFCADIYVGGSKGEDRMLHTAILGSAGQTLRAYYLTVRNECKPVGLNALTKDIAICASINVHRVADDPPPVLEDDYGLNILVPASGTAVGEWIRLEGTYKKKPPENRVIIYERTPDHLYWFKDPRPEFDEQKKRWFTEIYVGGTKNQNRDLHIATFGDAGNSLVQHFFAVHEECGRWIGVKQLTDDIVSRDRVTVRYK